MLNKTEGLKHKEKKLMVASSFLLALQQTQGSLRLQLTYNIPRLGPVCRKFYLHFWSLDVPRGDRGKTIKNLLQHLGQNGGMTPKQHGLAGRGNTTLDAEVSDAVLEFL